MNIGLNKRLQAFELKVRRKEFVSSHEIAESIIDLIRDGIDSVVSDETARKIVTIITKKLKKSFPNDVIIKNISSLILSNLESIPTKTSNSLVKSQSLCFIDFLTSPYKLEKDSLNDNTLRKQIIEDLDNLKENLGFAYQSIAKEAHGKIQQNDVILTVGYSNSVIHFLTQPDQKSNNICPTVIIPERAPVYDGYLMAEKLKSKGSNVIVIPDSAIFSILPKVNMIILSAGAVFTNGGIISFSLSHSIALAARHYSKPLIVLYWEMKLPFPPIFGV